MKLTGLFLVFALIGLSANAQQNWDYYKPPLERKLGDKSSTLEDLLKRADGDVKIKNRWYLSGNGFLRVDENVLSNSIDGLVSTKSPIAGAYGVSVGWVSNETWSLELDYARTAIHNVLEIDGGNNLLSYQFDNDKNCIGIRGNRRLLFGKKQLRKPAFWLGAGFSLVPNANKEKALKSFGGYHRNGRNQPVDTLQLVSSTYTSNAPTWQLDLQGQYVFPLAKFGELSFFARKVWGFGNSIETDLLYSVNGVENATATISGDGSGWIFGISLRYNMHVGYVMDGLRKLKI